MQAILLACWEKRPSLKADNWLAYAYAVAVSKLEGLLGTNMVLKANQDMTMAQKASAQAMIVLGREILSTPDQRKKALSLRKKSPFGLGHV